MDLKTAPHLSLWSYIFLCAFYLHFFHCILCTSNHFLVHFFFCCLIIYRSGKQLTKVNKNQKMCDHVKAVANPSVHQTLDELEFERSLCNAALNGEVERVKKHLRNGDDVNSLDSAGYAPLHYAARTGNIEIAHLLLSHGSDINIRTKAGKATPLLRAAFSGKEDMCKFLVEKGADIKAVDDDGQTVVHRSVKSGNLALANYFLEIAPELKIHSDNRGISPSQLCDL